MSRRWTDEAVETVIGNLLRAGVLLSAGVVLSGGILYLWNNGRATVDLATFRGEPRELRQLGAIVSGAFELDSRAIIQVGLLLLIATPVARVAFSIWAFAAERDWTYVVITTIVLVVLLYSLFGATG